MRRLLLVGVLVAVASSAAGTVRPGDQTRGIPSTEAAVAAVLRNGVLPHGTIVFQEERALGLAFELRTVDAAGGKPRALRGQHFYGVTPAYSLDGRYIAYGRWLSHAEDRDSRFGQDLVVARSDGTGAKVIVPTTDELRYPGSPLWSLDGRWITYLSSGPVDAGGRYIVGAGGGKPRKIRTADLALWSPTGAGVAAETGTGIAWIRAGHTKPERVISDARFPLWSPQRAEFAYIAPQGLYVFDTRTRRSRQLAPMGRCSFDEVMRSAAWSPDGRWIAYFTCSTNSYARSLFIVARDGGRRQLLVKSVLVGASPSWRN